MDAELPEMPPPTAHEPTAPLSSTKQTEETKDAQTNLDDLQLNLQNLTDRTLRFLANASNETLGACIVGLGAATYVVLGRVGLILIGIVGGVALHATWEGNLNDAGDSKAQNQEARRKERGVEVAHRLLQWRDTVHAQQETDSNEESNTQVKLYSGKTLDYSEFRPETAAALTELTDAVIRDYVKLVFHAFLQPVANQFEDGGIHLSYLMKAHSPVHAGRPSRPSSSLFPIISPEKDLQTLFSILSRTPPQ